jgi:trimeric autotransporter adhesin
MKKRNITFTTIFLILGFFALSPLAQAVVPPPDGGYPNVNTAEGQNALFSLTTGQWNTALGGFTLWRNTDGSFNTAVGTAALLSNIGNQANFEGIENTAVGAAALLSNTTGSNNTAVGVDALFHNDTGFNNTAIGVNALLHNDIGSNNCAFGSGALYSNTSGIYNTAIGTSALFNNAGSDNTAVGAGALDSNGDGIQNSAVGSHALVRNTGNFNTAIGYQALTASDTGSTNTAVGVNALLANTSGGANIALGYGAGTNVTTGSFNIYIGTNIGGVADEVGHTYISNIASTQQNLSPVTVDLATGLLGHEFSSQRYKEDVKPMDKASEALFELKPVTYRFKKEIDKSQAIDYGLIAEEVAKIDPNLAVRDGKGQIESIRYNAITAMLLNEFLKEHKRVEAQQSKIEEQEATIAELKSAAVRQQKGMDVLTAQLKEQAAQIQKVSTQIGISRSTTKVTFNNP